MVRTRRCTIPLSNARSIATVNSSRSVWQSQLTAPEALLQESMMGAPPVPTCNRVASGHPDKPRGGTISVFQSDVSHVCEESAVLR